MKDLAYYMNLPYKLEIVPDRVEGGFAAKYPELPGCITCADTLEQLFINAEDAKKAWLEASMEDGIIIPEPMQENAYCGQFKLRMPKSLHKSLAEHAKLEGVSMNQYCLYLLSKNDAVYEKNSPNMVVSEKLERYK